MRDDVLREGLKLVVCGTAAVSRSAQLKHYYTGPGNKFWRTLSELGLTPRQLAPREASLLLDFGIGLTDLVTGQPARTAAFASTARARRCFARECPPFGPRSCVSTASAQPRSSSAPERSSTNRSRSVSVRRMSLWRRPLALPPTASGTFSTGGIWRTVCEELRITTASRRTWLRHAADAAHVMRTARTGP